MNIVTDRNGNPILDQFSEEGFVDLVFRIQQLRRGTKNYRFTLTAAFGRKTVGLKVTMQRDMKSGFNAKMELLKKHVYRAGVVFQSIGEESDHLLRSIAKLYGVPRYRAHMVAKESFTAIALHQGKIDFEKDPVKLKLFGRDGEPFVEEAYYESFFNVDLANGFAFWNEKDSDYRAALLAGLSAD